MKRSALVFAFTAACGAAMPSGTGEPFVVQGAQFVKGPLPTSRDDGPRVTNVAVLNPNVLSGQSGKQIDGRAKAEASAVAVALDGVGTGHWVFPLRAPDPQYPGELTWGALCNFAPLPAAQQGVRQLHLAAIANDGSAGPRTDLTLCFEGPGPDGARVCDSSAPHHPAGVSLEWDADVDLDLVAIGPDGRTYTAKSPIDGEARIPADGVARCEPDPRRREDLVFEAKPSGTWRFYVSLFDACDKAGASFVLSARVANGDADVEVLRQAGRVTQLDAWGGTVPPLFVGEHAF